MMFKIAFGYKKCTLSYIEVKLRGVPKEEGYIYRLLDGFIELRKTRHFPVLMAIAVYILYTRTTFISN